MVVLIHHVYCCKLAWGSWTGLMVILRNIVLISLQSSAVFWGKGIIGALGFELIGAGLIPVWCSKLSPVDTIVRNGFLPPQRIGEGKAAEGTTDRYSLPTKQVLRQKRSLTLHSLWTKNIRGRPLQVPIDKSRGLKACTRSFISRCGSYETRVRRCLGQHGKFQDKWLFPKL